MQAEDRIRLQHMVDAAQMAQRFLAGRQRTDLDTDEMLRNAVARALEVIGEAAARVSAEGRAVAPTLPWASIVGMRNRIVHAYFDIDLDVLWKTADAELPELLRAIEAVLAARSPQHAAPSDPDTSDLPG